MTRALVIIGNGQMAELFWSHFTQLGNHHVAGFAVDRERLAGDRLLGLPVVAFDEIETHFGPRTCDAFVAIGPVQNNAIRAARFLELRRSGYRLASYISPHAVVSRDAVLGEHVVVGAFAVIQPWATVGDNAHVGGGSIVGHHSRIGEHAFLSLHVVMAGAVGIGERAFVGVGATIRDNVTVGCCSVVGAGATILNDVDAHTVHVAPRAIQLPMRADAARL